MSSAPSFGAERRGAPVTASTRLSREPLRMFSQIERPDAVVVLDETLLLLTQRRKDAKTVAEAANREIGVPGDSTAGLESGGWLIINSHLAPDLLGLAGDFRVATADATTVAQEVGLVVAGSVIVNTAMLGAFARATDLVSIEDIHEAIDARFSAELARKNFDAARITYERTVLK